MNFNQPYNDPQNYYWFQHGFSKEELDKIYNDVTELPFDPATIDTGNSLDENKQIRSSSKNGYRRMKSGIGCMKN